MARRRRTIEHAEELRTQAALDPFRDFQGSKAELAVAKFFHFMRGHVREVLYGVGAVILGGALLIAYFVYDGIRRERSLSAFEELLKEPVMAVGSGAEKAALDKLDAYEKSYGDKQAHYRASLHRLDLYGAMGKHEESAKTAENLANDLNQADLQAYFAFRSAAHYEQAKNCGKGSELYARAANLIPEYNRQKAMALFGALRCLMEIGKETDARDTAKKLFEAKDTAGADDVKTAAAAYLLSRKK